MTSIERASRPLAALLIVAMLAGCGASDATGPGSSAPTSIVLQSDAGDYIGAGRSYSFSQANAAIGVRLVGNTVIVDITAEDRWNGSFQLPALAKGTYTGTRSSLEWIGAGRGCNTITGTIIVDGISVVNGALTSLDLRFEQHCEGMPPALRGTIHYNALDATAPSGPAAIPNGLWQPPAQGVPTGNSVFLYSDQGDFIGQGATLQYTAPSTSISVTSNGKHVTVSVAGWSGDFQAMSSLATMQVGYYAGLTRYPFNNPAKGGLDWSGQGRGCNRLTGWFAVDKVSYSGTTITSLDLRFEQHCEGGLPALRGVVHYVG